jgi:hypothetical protein
VPPPFAGAAVVAGAAVAAQPVAQPELQQAGAALQQVAAGAQQVRAGAQQV